MSSQSVKITPYSVEYFLECGENGEREHYLRFFETEGELFHAVSKMYAFDDCNPISIDHIQDDYHTARYVGWQPGMKFEFKDDYTGETLYIGWFPEWDH